MSREPDKLLPAGPYLLAVTWFRRQKSQKGNTYLNCRVMVVAGDHKGDGFFSPISLEMSQPASRRRWEIMLEQVGCTEEVDLDSDASIEKAIKGRVFKALVSSSEFRGEAKNSLQRLFYPRQYSHADWEAIDAWEKEWAERGWQYRDPSDPGHQDKDAPDAGPRSEPQWSEGSRFADEDDGDDVPF